MGLKVPVPVPKSFVVKKTVGPNGTMHVVLRTRSIFRLDNIAMSAEVREAFAIGNLWIGQTKIPCPLEGSAPTKQSYQDLTLEVINTTGREVEFVATLKGYSLD